MHGLVLAGGLGARLRPFTYAFPKHLVPLLGRALVEYPVLHLAEAGVREVGVVVGYLGELIRERLGDGGKYGARLRYVVQERRLGIAHAINLAIEEGVVGGPFVVYLGDNILRGGIKGFVERFREGEYDVFILLSRVSDPSRFGVALVREERVVRLVEKPRKFVSDLAVVGVYFFRDPDLVQRAFKSLRPSWRGEYEVTELIQWFIDNGYNVGYDVVRGWWKDVGTWESLLEALYLLLDEVQPRMEGKVEGEVVGRVIVEEDAVVEGKVYGPAYIGKGAHVAKNAKVEHYASLEQGARLKSGSITRSLVMDEANIDLGEARMVDSIIGRRATVKVERERFNGTLRLLLSDHSSVNI